MRGVQPGPLLLINNSDLVYTFFVGFVVVNILVLIIGHFFIQLGDSVLTPRKAVGPSHYHALYHRSIFGIRFDVQRLLCSGFQCRGIFSG